MTDYSALQNWWTDTIREEFENKHLPAIQEYLRIPSISATGEGIEETAEATAAAIKKLGADNVEIAPTKGWPVVYGELISDPDKLTVLFYSMYDVQPVEPEKWIVPPFDGAVVEDFEGMGRSLVARGVINTKGPTMAFFQTLKSVVDSGKDLPVNVIFAIEGEEELGSRNFPEFVQNYQKQLGQADVMFFPFFSETVRGRINLYLGNRGIIYFKIRVQGGEWGGPRSRHIHSSTASLVDSPTWKLIHLIAKMRDKNGQILIPGIYEKVREVSEEDQNMVKELVKVFNAEEFKQMNDIARFFVRNDGEELKGEKLLNQMFQPCLTVDGIISGYTEEEGTKTVLPYNAFANMDIRLVPDMEVADTREKISAFIKKECPEAELTMEEGYSWTKMPPTHPYVQAQIEILKETKKEIEIWPMILGSAPFYIFQDTFNMPFVLGGLGHGARAHSPNEYAFLESKTGAGGIIDFEMSIAKLLCKLAETGRLT